MQIIFYLLKYIYHVYIYFLRKKPVAKAKTNPVHAAVKSILTLFLHPNSLLILFASPNKF